MSTENSHRIIEGRCPSCDGPLERRERDGWCPACGCGWAYKTTGPKTATVTLTIEPVLAELNTSLGRFTSSSSARVTSAQEVAADFEAAVDRMNDVFASSSDAIERLRHR